GAPPPRKLPGQSSDYTPNGTLSAGNIRGTGINAYASYLLKTDSLGSSGCFEKDLDVTVLNLEPKFSNYDLIIQEGGLTEQDVMLTVRNLPFSQKTICTNFQPTAQLPGDTTLCFGTKLTIDARLVNGLPTNTSPQCRFLWSTGDTTPVVNFSKAPGMHKIWVQISKGGCVSSDTMQATFLQNFLVDLGPDKEICPYDSTLLNAGTHAVNFNWYLPGGDTVKAQQIFTQQEGQYRVRVADAGGCVDLDTIHISHYPLPKTSAGPDSAICFGQTITLQGEGGITYTWQPPDHLDNAFVANPNATPPDSIRYWLITSNQQGCRDTDDVFIAVSPPLFATLPGQLFVCPGDSFRLEATDVKGDTGHYTFTWTDSAGTVLVTGNPAFLHQENITSKMVNLKLEDGCSNAFIDSIEIIVNPAADAAFTATPTEGCAPLTVAFQSTGSGWEWAQFTAGEGDTSETIIPQHTYRQPGIYHPYFSIITKAGCTDSSSQTIIVHATPTANFTAAPQPTRIPNTTITFSANVTDADFIEWDFGDGATEAGNYETIHTYPDTGRYTVMLTATNAHCTSTYSRTIIIRDLIRIHLPNAFSPGNDGLNETFTPVTTAIAHYQLTIYNRWGEQIWKGENEGWNGTSGGAMVPEGVYLYLLKATDDTSAPHFFKGNVTVVK
ncbi:MAG: PKD domain-containing protein, partial [Bacteroidia bacterium]